jgi:hypothetical protein
MDVARIARERVSISWTRRTSLPATLRAASVKVVYDPVVGVVLV